MSQIVTGQNRRVADFVAAKIGNGNTFANYAAVGLEKDGELIAGVVYSEYNGSNVFMHVGATGKRWLTREYLWFCFYYPFEQMGVKRITGVVEEGNIAARMFDEHLGFQLETRLQDAGRSGDLLIYRMFKDECKFLRKPHG